MSKMVVDIHGEIEGDYEIIKKYEERQWIPVSERLPDEELDVLICNAEGKIEIAAGFYSTEAGGFTWCTSGWKFGKVIAWMPLPKPYKEGSEENKNER